MNRRSVLRTLAGVGALGGVANASAHPKGSGATGDGVPSETPSGPGPLGSLPLAGTKEAVVRDETTVFLATTDGFATVDASDPADPTVEYRTDAVLGDREHGPMAGIWDVAVDGDRLLVVGPANGGVNAVHAAVVYDVADPATPERVTVHETDSPIHNAALADGVAYLTANGSDANPLVTVDAATGAELGRWSLFDRDDAWRDVAPALRVLHDVRVRGDHAYLAHWDAGTWILDVTDPATPEVVSRVRGRQPAELAAVDDVRRESTELPGNDHFVAVNDDATLLGVGVEAWDADEGPDRGPGGVHLYDVSDLTAPEKRSSIAPPPTPDASRGGVWTTAHNFELVDDSLYSSWYQGGVKVHDVADPANPRELLHWRDADRAKFWTAQLGVPGEFFVASSWENPGDEGEPGGLFTFPDPTSESGGGLDATAGFDATAGLGALVGAGLGALGVGVWRNRR